MKSPAAVAWSSSHRGAGAVVDADGALALSFGDIERPIFPRSAVKSIQALPLIESGAADKFALTETELALACASHSGEPAHVACAARDARAKRVSPKKRSPAARIGRLNADAARALAREGRVPSALHNNCSGKHAGFLCVACALGVETGATSAPSTAVQREVKAALEDVCGERLDEDRRGIRWLLDPDLRDVAEEPRARLRADGDRTGLWARFGPRRRNELFAAIAAHPFTSRARTVSTPTP